MPTAIDPRLTSAFNDFTSSEGTTPHAVDHNEAKNLINLAKTMDKESSHLFGLVSLNKGRKQLTDLYKNNPGKFSPVAKGMLEEFTNERPELNPHLIEHYLRFTSDIDNTPGAIDREEALELIGYANAINRDNLRYAILPTPVGTEGLSALLNHTRGTFNNAALNDVTNFVANTPVRANVLEWKSPKKTWHCHWFPMKETKPDGGDPINNLYAPGGVLEKYDTAFSSKSREYELKRNFRSHDSEKSDANWAGHCNNASEVACLLDEPKYPVTYNGVTFSPNEIAGLLVKVSRSLAGRVDFEGQRFNTAEVDDPGDPKPHVFLEKVLKGWGSEATTAKPFVLDTDRNEQVWNYPYDQGSVVNLGGAPKHFPLFLVPEGERISFFEAKLKGTDFDQEAQTYQFWIQYDEQGNALKSDWIPDVGTGISPDFAWQPHPTGDLTLKENWTKKSRYGQSNPHVLPENVYEIYMRSINKDYDSLSARAARWYNGRS